MATDTGEGMSETVHVAAADGRTCELCKEPIAGVLRKPYDQGQRVVVQDGAPAWETSWRLPNCTMEWQRRRELQLQLPEFPGAGS